MFSPEFKHRVNSGSEFRAGFTHFAYSFPPATGLQEQIMKLQQINVNILANG